MTACAPAPPTPAPSLAPGATETRAQIPVDTAAATITPSAIPPTLGPPPGLEGFRVAYTRDGELWGWQNGNAQPLAKGGRIYAPRFSPDGSQVAYLQQVDDFHLELWVVDVEDGSPRRLVSVADLDTIGATARSADSLAITPYQFAWVGEGRQIAFNTQQVFRGPNPAPLDDLNLVDVASGELSFILLAGWGGEFAFSPDGSQAAISTPTQIILVDADGGNYRSALTYDPVITYHELRYYARPVWLPDGSALRVIFPPPDALAETPGLTELWSIPVGGAAQRLMSFEAVPDFDTPAALAPDAGHLIYLKETGDAAELLRTLSVGKPDGSESMVYTGGVQLQFWGWAADSLHFFYSLGETTEMYVGKMAEPPQLLQPGVDGLLAPRWLGEERYLVLRQTSLGFEIQVGLVGGGLVRIDALNAYPAFDVWTGS